MIVLPTWPRALILGVLALGAASALAQNELRSTFFKDADAAKAAADAVDAEWLAPRSYERGMREYEDAEKALERGRNIEYVRTNAAEAANYFTDAAKAAQLARTALAQALKSRQDAANAQAPKLSPDLWEDAQDKFGDAIRYLETGNLKSAKRYLGETRQLLSEADRRRVGRYAPITLGKAKQLLADAERELNENRYDTDLPRSLAQQANYEAKHAIYLSEIVLKVRDKDLTPEQLVLLWEEQFRAVAGAADVIPDMHDGPDRLTAGLVTYIEDIRNEKQALEQENADNQLRLADMEEELRALDERLGGATAERTALIQRIEAQERIKEQFEQIERMFSNDEARVFRQGNTIIMRLVGLTFDSGSAQLKPANFDLLAKVEKAIDVFPRSELIIEGHTDSHGSDDLNQKLSQDRAESVQQYMINAMRIPSYRLIATGYGETRPVASNETASGREKNRRIDIVIKPNLDAS
jgi:outer membrane protein OmpA-like peptidoglycan-associated protein